MNDVPVKSVRKALDLLSMLVFDDPGLGGLKLTVLAHQLGLPANTTHNLLKTMMACGYVEQNEAGRYRPGPQCGRIGLLNTLQSDEFKQKLAEVLKRHASQINEAMVFAALHGGKRIVLASSEPVSQFIRIDRQGVEKSDIYSLPTGRVLVAFAAPEDAVRIHAQYGGPGEKWPQYEADLARIRKEKRCLMLPDRNGINSFAVPVITREGHLLGAVGCYAPAFRSGPAVRKKILAVLRSVAGELA